MPDTFRVFRGVVGPARVDWSWTLRYHIADSYTRRFDDMESVAEKDKGVLTALVKKEDIVGLLRDSDFQVIVDPRRLQAVSPFLCSDPAPGTPHLAAALAARRAAEEISNVTGFWMSGPAHWLKVDHNAIQLCERTPGADLLVCRLFAFLHDCTRSGDWYEDGHGEEAAEYVEQRCEELTAGLTPSQRARLLEAIRYHGYGWTCKDPTIAVCWDADRLDLPNLYEFLDEELLSTAAARELQWLI